MEFIPGLSDEEQAFARAYYPIFDDVKSVLLMVAGIVLLLGDDQKKIADFDDTLLRIEQDLKNMVGDWAAFRPDSVLQQDYVTVAGVLEAIETAISEMNEGFTTISEGAAAALANTLFTAYQALRTVALNYWRLELMAESGMLKHVH